MNLAWPALSEATARRSASTHSREMEQQQQRDAAGRSGGMLALLLGGGRAGGVADAAGVGDADRYDHGHGHGHDGEEGEVEVQASSSNASNVVNNDWVYPCYEVDFGWRPTPPLPARTSSPPPSSRIAPTSGAQPSAASSSSTSSPPPSTMTPSTAFGPAASPMDEYLLHLPRPSLPSFEPMPMSTSAMPAFMPSSSSAASLPFCPATAAAPFEEADLFGRLLWPSTPAASASSSSLPDIFRPSILFGPSSTSTSSSSAPPYASSWPPPLPTYDAASGHQRFAPGSDSASSSSASSSFSCSPPATAAPWLPWQASASPATSPTFSSSSSFSSPELSMASTYATTAPASAGSATTSSSRSRRKRALSSGAASRTADAKGKQKAGPPSAAAAAAPARKPILRRKMEEEYYHYLKEKLSRMESTRKKRTALERNLESLSSSSSLSSSPESSDLACRWSPELGALSADDLRKEEEQLYMSGTAMECFRHFHEKISSFLVVEKVELTNEEWIKSVLRGLVCQVTPFALKINAILAFGALIGGQRQWADIFFDKWRRLLTEFFDSSEYEVAEGLTVMSYYLFFLGDIARSRCYGESAAQISVRARPGGGVIFIRAQTITEIISNCGSADLCEDLVGGASLYLRKPLLTFPTTIDDDTRLAVSVLLEQLILVSSRIHMWRMCQQIAECRERGRRARRRRKSAGDTCGGPKKRSQCTNAALSSPLHQLSVLQAVEEKLESLEQRHQEAVSHASKKPGGAGRKGSAQLTDIHSLTSTAGTSEHGAFLGDLLAFARFVLCSVRVDCHREAGMTKNAYISAEKLLIQLEREADRCMKFVAVLSPLVLSFISPVIELLCGPLQEQFLSAADSLRATTLLLPLRDVFPAILPVNFTAAAAALHASVSLPVSTSTSSSAT